MINFRNAKSFEEGNIDVRFDTYVRYCIEKVTIDGMWLEFGVATAESSKKIIEMMPSNKSLYGFDWFKGLPEDWWSGNKAGELFGSTYGFIPKMERLEIIEGLFEDTIPKFNDDHKENIAFMHVDCDLYSSTKTIFDNLKDRIVPGTIIIFDEVYNYADYGKHEYKAFMEYVNYNNIIYEWIAYVSGSGQQAGLKIL